MAQHREKSRSSMDFLGGFGAGRGRALQGESPEELSRAGEAQPSLYYSLEELSAEHFQTCSSYSQNFS